MKIRSLPKEVLAEFLYYIADHEPLEKLQKMTTGQFSIDEARDALREVASQLGVESLQEGSEKKVRLKNVSTEVRHLLSALSPMEEQKLLKVFGLLEA